MGVCDGVNPEQRSSLFAIYNVATSDRQMLSQVINMCILYMTQELARGCNASKLGEQHAGIEGRIMAGHRVQHRFTSSVLPEMMGVLNTDGGGWAGRPGLGGLGGKTWGHDHVRISDAAPSAAAFGADRPCSTAAAGLLQAYCMEH